MTLHATPRSTDRQPRLTGADWIEAALDVLVESGIEAVQITALSRQMSVTRGSFYWHFDSREDLLDALIAEWRARNTGVMVEAIAETSSLEDGILKLFAVWVDHNPFRPQRWISPLGIGPGTMRPCVRSSRRKTALASRRLPGSTNGRDTSPTIRSYAHGSSTSRRSATTR